MTRTPYNGRRRRPYRALSAVRILAIALTVLVVAVSASPASAAPARINGSGSSYVALAMQQWVADAQVQGLAVNYLPTGSPQGLQGYGSSTLDFAGTEAEFSALGASGGEDGRGYQYVPSVAGAVAVLYNVKDKAGRKVDYLNLSRRTIARIFMGDITKWSDAAITTDNKGLVLPDEPITVVYRAGQSGTTGLFYDFVANTAPEIFSSWTARNQLPTTVRIVQLDSAPNFAPKTRAYNGSDQIAQGIAGSNGLWSIGYDEFGYAKTYKNTTAWVENQSGEWVKPYAENISAALESAKLRPDLSQDLTGVYTSGNPLTYPISAYSYIVTQCKNDGSRPTCKDPYTNSGITETLTKWLRYIACEGQVNMAKIGYSPLPPLLSQEVANAIGRLEGKPAEQFNADNCVNPRFRGSLGEGFRAPENPLKNKTSLAPGATNNGTTNTTAKKGTAAGKTPGAAGSSGASGANGAGAGAGAGAVDPSTGAPLAEGEVPGEGSIGADGTPLASESGAQGNGGAQLVAGGSGSWRDAAPVDYDRPGPASSSLLVLGLLLLLLLGPPLLGSFRRPRPAGE